MNLIEVLPNSTSVSAPGWAYVPDTGYDPSKVAIQPSGARKRARIANNIGGQELSAKQHTQLLRRLADLDKDNHKDVQIPLPNRQKDAGARAPKGKTPAVRKILLAQKTFPNYIDDEEAFAAQEQQHSNAAGSSKHRPSLPSNLRHASSLAPEPSIPATTTVTDGGEDVAMADAQPADKSSFHHDVDPIDEHLLASTVPKAPSRALMEALVNAPPLSYNAARVAPSSLGRPQRKFCEICGYWGTVRCMKCGARVCGLSCKETHDSERCQSFYA